MNYNSCVLRSVGVFHDLKRQKEHIEMENIYFLNSSSNSHNLKQNKMSFYIMCNILLKILISDSQSTLLSKPDFTLFSYMNVDLNVKQEMIK